MSNLSDTNLSDTNLLIGVFLLLCIIYYIYKNIDSFTILESFQDFSTEGDTCNNDWGLNYFGWHACVDNLQCITSNGGDPAFNNEGTCCVVNNGSVNNSTNKKVLFLKIHSE
jgi:hypothetical protein